MEEILSFSWVLVFALVIIVSASYNYTYLPTDPFYFY